MLINTVSSFLEQGGTLLSIILLTSILLWSLICERLVYLKYQFPIKQKEWLKDWQTSPPLNQKQSLHVKQLIICQAKICLESHTLLIKTLIALCPLQGLLGTVTGMIHVFDVMSVIGNNPRALAAGISQATLSTMAGMVIAISGLYFLAFIQNQVQQKLLALKEKMKTS